MKAGNGQKPSHSFPGNSVPAFLSKTSSSVRIAGSKGELIGRWERKATDLEKLADRRDDRGDDGTDLRIISDILRCCATELTQIE